MSKSVVQPPSLYILGTRGVPAAHGGFETFAHRFALHMRDNGWNVTVYCQANEGPRGPIVDEWEGVRRVTFVAGSGAAGTIAFDWKCVMHARGENGVMLVLGYNTAIFSALLRLAGKSVVTNMDGIEWKRAKWPWHGRIWLYINEWIGAVTSTKLVADHPEIERHLRSRRSPKDIVMIPYGADAILDAPEAPVRALGLSPGRYLISIGRMEPENNILQMVEGFVRGGGALQMVCLGKLEPEANSYHAAVMAAGAGRVIFPGAIYDVGTIRALRFHAAAYCHGHSVGGTNPSLVEALGAGNAIIAHDNPYNRWVAGSGQFYFSDSDNLSELIAMMNANPQILEDARKKARVRFQDGLTWPPVLKSYEDLIVLEAKRGFVQKRKAAGTKE